MWWGTWLVALVAAFFVCLIGYWFIHGYFTAHDDRRWHALLEAFEGSATKVVAHAVGLIGMLLAGAPEWLSIASQPEAAAVVRMVWPEWAGIVLAVIALLMVIARNRSLHSA